MIKVENIEVFGWESVIRGMRNSKNSWYKSDSFKFPPDENGSRWFGLNDLGLIQSLISVDNDHSNFM